MKVTIELEIEPWADNSQISALADDIVHILSGRSIVGSATTVISKVWETLP